MKTQPKSVATKDAGQPLGWIERTLLAVDGNRVFIEASDAQLREELIEANAAQHHDVIATSNREALLEFMAHLPVPRDSGNDIVIAQADAAGIDAANLRRELEARGWSIPVLTVSPRARLDGEGGVS
jgi:hypothetical protein